MLYYGKLNLRWRADGIGTLPMPSALYATNMKHKVHALTLIVAKGCNLFCTYCYECHKSNEMMPCDVALRIVAHELLAAEREGSSTFRVTFMGGEPFLNFDVIKIVVEWLISQDAPIKIEAYATTNGTLITEEIKKWLVAHRDVFKVQLSYDGGDWQQRTNRTDKQVDLDFFLKTFPLQGLHMTVSKATLPKLAQGVFEMLDKGARCSINLAIGVDWTDDDAKMYLRELRIIANRYLQQFSESEPISTLTKSLGLIGEKPLVKPSCRECVDFACYDADGTIYPCHLFSPIVGGYNRVISMSAFECDDTMKQFGCKDDPYCADCPLCNWCPTCYGFNYLLTGSTGTKDHRVCKMMFAQALAASEFQVRYYRHMGVTQENASKVKSAIRAYRLCGGKS